MTAAAGSLWDGTAVFEQRHQKSARVLVALERVLARERPLGGAEREFCALVSEIAALEPALFTRVWTDPSAYRWVRMAYHLTDAVRRGGEAAPEARAVCRALGDLAAPQALRQHLGEFKRFVAALEHLRGGERRFAAPLRLALPFALPGTPLSLEGAGEVELLGVAGGGLRLRRGAGEQQLPLAPGAHAAGLSVRVCPTVATAGCQIRLQPQAFQLPGVRFAEALLRWSGDYQEAQRPLFEQALCLVARHLPARFAQLREAVRVVALKPLRSGDFTNASLSDLPGAFVVAVLRQPYELADSLIHELHHDRLFALEERGGFFESAEAGVRTERYYSPWRDEPRSLQGILHAVYVHQPVWEFWRSVLEARPPEPRLLDYARDRSLRYGLQLSIGLRQLARHARFSAHGASLFESLQRGGEEIRKALVSDFARGPVAALVCDENGTLLEERDAASGRPLMVHESLGGHVRRFAPEDQRDDALAALA